ncbi:hypothetical protein CTAYLR_002004 [Chrysophaeum taylorii]|uniref:TOG domain-containing protein n=1 Tax=Chrysophaeum taylorii TaxID=2483200 RepID=A0AAD7XJA7_9STRA|nr:hypothetical protein CTAYLR_002004 [Chrysophaeum taylorii]
MDEEVASIVEGLESGEWKVRVDALKELERLATSLGDAPSEQKRSAAVVLRGSGKGGIVEGVATNAKDLRSLVAAEACRAACKCAECLGGDGFCEAWLEAMVALSSGSSPKVVCVAAGDAARALVRSTVDKANFVVSRLVESATKAKAAPTRRACLTYAAEATRTWPRDAVEPFASALAQCVVDRARDADGGARAAARDLWFALRDAGFQTETLWARERLDASTRKQLDRDAATKPESSNKRPPPAAARPKPSKTPRPPQPPKQLPQRVPVHTSHHGRDVPVVVVSPPPPPPEEKTDDDEDDDPPPPTEAPPPDDDDDRHHDEDEEDESEEDDYVDATVAVSELVKQAASQHWDLRRDAISSLRGAVGSSDPEAWRCVAGAVSDAHHQVAGCALRAAAKALARDSRPTSELVLGALLVGAARRTVDARQQLRAAATRVLDASRRAIPPGSLLCAVAPSLGELSPLKARAALLDFARALIRARAPNPSLFGELAFKLALTLTATHGDARRPAANEPAACAFNAAAECADALRRVDPPAFAERVASFAPEMRRAIRDALVDAAPEFDDHLQAARKMVLATRAGDEEDLLLKQQQQQRPAATPGPSRRRHEPAPVDEDISDALSGAIADLAAEAGDPEGAAERASRARQTVAKLAAKRHQAWGRYFDQLAMLLLEKGCARRHQDPRRHHDPLASFFEDEDDVQESQTISLSELASRLESIATLRVLARRLPDRFAVVLDSAVPRLLAVAKTRHLPYELTRAAERALVAAAHKVDAKVVFALATADLAASRADDVAPPARVVAEAAKATPAADVADSLPTLLPKLAAATDAPDAAVRKAAVDVFVEFYHVLGDTILPRLKALLSDAKLKLLAMYVNKRGPTSFS